MYFGNDSCRHGCLEEGIYNIILSKPTFHRGSKLLPLLQRQKFLFSQNPESEIKNMVILVVIWNLHNNLKDEQKL